MSTCIYISFDIHHDRELYDRLLDQSGTGGFTVSGRSETPFAAEVWDTRLRYRIRNADQMIVICGEHSEASKCMSDEIRIAQEEGTPYFLLWGRRGAMCTKPLGAKNAEGIYNWTPAILQDQIAIARRSRTRALANAKGRGSVAVPQEIKESSAS